MPVNSFSDYPMSWKPDRNKLKRPIYDCLSQLLREDIEAGYLPPGTRLPPQRELADFLDINFTTVTRAYRKCELEGLLYAVPGSGTFVAYSAKAVTISRQKADRRLIDLGFVSSFEECNALLTDAIREVAQSRGIGDLLDYENPTGLPHQRAAGANWLSTLGVETDAEHVAIVSGTMNGLALTLFALFAPQDRVAVDTYTYANFIELAKMFHIQLVPIPTDEEGMLPDELLARQKLTPIRGVYLVPSCGNPTTLVISEKRKEELAKIIRRHDMILIEDEIHAFLLAGTDPDYQGSMSRFVPDQTIYLCGATKPLCSGLRIAYLVYPDRFKEKILEAMFNVNVKTSSLDAEIITSLLVCGKGSEIIKTKKEIARKRNEIFYEFFPKLRGEGNPLSFYRWLPIADHKSGTQVERELKDRGILVYHSDRFLSGQRKERSFLRVSLSMASSEAELREGLSILLDWVLCKEAQSMV